MTGEHGYEAVIKLEGAKCVIPSPVVISHLFTPTPPKWPNKSLSAAFLIGTPKRLETPVIHRKQNSEPISNRYKNATLPGAFKPRKSPQVCSAGPAYPELRRVLVRHLSTRYTERLETPVIHRKQDSAPISSRYKSATHPGTLKLPGASWHGQQRQSVLAHVTLLALISSLCCAAFLLCFAKYEILAMAGRGTQTHAPHLFEPMEITRQSAEAYAIKTDQLTRKFGDMIAVDALNLRISSGKIFGLLGPNGAGKSTTIKMLTTLLEPTSGSATVAGFDIVREPARVRRHIGYVPQLLSADGGLTGFENLMLSAKLYGMPRTERKGRIAEALDFMGLTESGKRLVKIYSGGMIRRLELAQAMLHRPTVMFLDEPTIGLDPVARHAVWDRLEDLQQDSKMTVLITTHDMDEADELCDELAILHQGKVAAVGEPDALKATVGPDATLDDVFAHFSGGSIQEGGSYRDVRQARRTASRLG
jgi:ABC-2 type transport system ATP-binding protein